VSRPVASCTDGLEVIAASTASELTPLHGMISVGSEGNPTALRGDVCDPTSDSGISGRLVAVGMQDSAYISLSSRFLYSNN
jgi:hypothetical protein